MYSPATAKKKSIIFVAALIVILFGVYWKTFNYELVWDSKIYFQQNILLRESYPIWSSFKFGYFQEQLGAGKVDFYYRPLITASFLIENKIWGIKNTNLRFTNLLIYLFSLVSLYFLFKNHSDENYFPEITTLLFALNPLNVDNLVWIIGRGDLFMLLWGSLTFLFLEFFIKRKKYYFLVCSSFFYLLGIFSKEGIIFFLPVLFLYERIRRKKISFPYHISNILISIFFFVLKHKVLGLRSSGFTFFSNPIHNLKLSIASLGYYFRTMVFPVYYDMFLTLKEVMNLFYFLLGILIILLFIYLLYKTKKDSELLIPLSLTIAFLGGHLLLLFTVQFPFKIYSRYMMIPALGLIWIFSKAIIRLKEKLRLSLVFLILISFIPSLIYHAYSYRTELSFFKKAIKSSPENGYLHFAVGKSFYDKKEYLNSELSLYRALFYSQKKGTKILANFLLADIEFRRASYNSVFKWLQEIEKFEKLPNTEIAPLVRFQINHQKAMAYIAQGKIDLAEQLLKENMEKQKNSKDSYNILYLMYIGQNMWEKAKNHERIIKNRFPSSAQLDTSKLKRKFNSLSPEKKISFFIRYRNFEKAADIITTQAPLDLNLKILLSKVLYWGGREDEAKKVVDEIFSEYSDDFGVLNTLGYYYLKDLIRVKKALFYFNKSLEINHSQPEIFVLIHNLTDSYLNELERWNLNSEAEKTS